MLAMVQVIVEVTWKCPCNCSFCPVPKTGETMPPWMLRRIADAFDAAFKDVAIVISGGEPSVLPNLKEYVDAVRGSYPVTIATNAYSPESIMAAEPDLVEVSIDYGSVEHDIHRGVQGLFYNALALLQYFHNKCVVRSTLTKDNAKSIINLRMRLDAMGLRNVPILVMPVRGRPELKPSKEDIKVLAEYDNIILSDTCPAGISSFVVTPRRTILPCIFYREEIGRLEAFTAEEILNALDKGSRIPRFPCERYTFP